MNKVLADATLTGVVVLNYDTCRQRRLFVDFPGFALPILQPVVAENPQPQSAASLQLSSPVPHCRGCLRRAFFKKNPRGPNNRRTESFAEHITGFRCRKIHREGLIITVASLRQTVFRHGPRRMACFSRCRRHPFLKPFPAFTCPRFYLPFY